MRTPSRRPTVAWVTLAAVLALSGCGADAPDPASAPDQAGKSTAPADPAPVPVKRLRADAHALADDFLAYDAVRGEYPHFAEMLDTRLAPGVLVTQYTTTDEMFRYCLISEADGSWVAFQSDRGGVTATGDDGRCTFVD